MDGWMREGGREGGRDRHTAMLYDLSFHQDQLKEQELRNERLSVKLQQRCFQLLLIHMHALIIVLPTTTQSHTHRPEADDLKAMQQELSSLHLLMEQSSGEHERKMQLLSIEKQRIEDDKTR